MPGKKNTRRRGDELLESLFEATIKLIKEVNPAAITFQQIADAAKTSRSVLYRRWATPFHLLQDIYVYKAQKLFDGDFFDELKDTGSLRDDLIQMLHLYQSVYEETGMDIINTYYFLRTQDKEGLREPAVHNTALEKHLKAVKKILKHAKARGEKINKVSRVTLMLPYDLVRFECLFRPGNLDKIRIETMVDEVLLPVIKK